MEQNNFEKYIHQKLDELKIPPSDSVWLNIEKRIEKKDQRRWKVFIILFLFLFVFTGGYWLINFEKNKSQHQKTAGIFEKKHATSAIKKDSSTNLFLIPGKIDSNAAIKINENPVDSNTIVENEKAHNLKSRKNISIKEGHIKAEIQNAIAWENENKKQEDDEENVSKMQNDLPAKKEGVTKPEDGIVNAMVEKPTMEKTLSDSTLLIHSEKKSEIKDSNWVVKNEKATNSNHQRKWSLGVAISGGTSLVGNNPLGTNNNGDYYSNPNQNPGGIYIPSVYSASPIKNSFGFAGGVFAEKNISVKSKISIGINYKYFSAINKVGSRIDSIITAYNSTGSANSFHNYHNHFHYLELPVSLKFTLGNSKSLPLYWQAGLSISKLVSTNALQFKTNSGVYYHDNSLFNKTQIGFSSGVSALLFSRQKYPVSIGPYFYYSLSSLSKEGLYHKKNLSFIGISTGIVFGKK